MEPIFVDKVDYTNHIGFNSSGVLNNIIDPLNKHFGINSFVHLRKFKQNYEMILTNQPRWSEHYYSRRLFINSQFPHNHQPNLLAREQVGQFSFVLWSELCSNHKIILNEANLFDIKHGVTIKQYNKNYTDYYFIGTTSQNSNIVSKYLNNMDLVYSFLNYYNLQANSLINKSSKSPILLIDHTKNNISNNEHSELGPEFISYSQKIQFLRHIIPIKLTEKELKFSSFLVKKYSSKEIAAVMEISPRTVEDYLDRLKYKTYTNTRSELIEYLLQFIPVKF